MLRRATIVVCVLSLAVSSALVASATTYTFTTLLPAGSDTMSLGMGVNTVGGVPEAVGHAATSHITWYNRGNADMWSSTGTATNLSPYISGVTYSAAEAVDPNGNIVGSAYISSLYNAFYLPAGGTSATILPNLSAGTGTYAYGRAQAINSAGQVVGYSYGTDNNYHAAIWSKTGSVWGITDLGASGYASCAIAINANGVIAGQWTQTSGNYAGYIDAATWSWNGSAWVVNDLINRSLPANSTGTATAFAINDSGVAVGNGSLASFPALNCCALKFNGDGTVTNLGNLYNGNTSTLNGTLSSFPFRMSAVSGTDAALAINDNGVIVGESATASSGANIHAFIYGYQGYNHMQDMNTVFAGIIPSGMTLICATSIDNNGDITGLAYNSSGVSEGFLIAPAPSPEPSTLLLVATGLTGLLAYAWHRRR